MRNARVRRGGVAALVAGLAALVPLAAGAGGGALEINQTCARKTGCFPGDDPGFPVTITAPGSYRLTGNLATWNSSLTAILIRASDVTVDLGGFTIACGLSPQITPLGCVGSGTGDGVAVDDPAIRARISVRNGVIRQMGRDGVRAGSHSRVEGLEVGYNRGTGIRVTGTGALVSGNLVFENGSRGIEAGDAAIVRGNAVYRNDGTGIAVGQGSSVSGNTVFENGGIGIALNVGSAYRDNTVYNNGSNQVFGGDSRGGNLCRVGGSLVDKCP